MQTIEMPKNKTQQGICILRGYGSGLPNSYVINIHLKHSLNYPEINVQVMIRTSFGFSTYFRAFLLH